MSCYNRLGEDDSVMVRRAAASCLAEIISMVSEGGGELPAVVMEHFRQISEDEQETVRIFTIENCTLKTETNVPFGVFNVPLLKSPILGEILDFLDPFFKGHD